MTSRKLAALGCVVVLTASGCASRRESQPVSWGDAPTVPTVTVRNDNWLDVAVYVVRGATRFRIGTVRSTSMETFRLPSGSSGGSSPLQIMADPIGSAAGYVTDPIVLGPGQRLELKVASPISVSTFSIWNR